MNWLSKFLTGGRHFPKNQRLGAMEQAVDPLADAAGRKLWNKRGKIEIAVAWNDEQANMSRHSWTIQDSRIEFADGSSIVSDTRWGQYLLETPEGDKHQVRNAEAGALDDAWVTIFAQECAKTIGDQISSIRYAPTPQANARDRLGRLIAQSILKDGAIACTEQWLNKPDFQGSYRGDEPPDVPAYMDTSPWRRLPGDVLVVRNKDDEYYVSHPRLGVVNIKGKDIPGALETRRQRMLTESFATEPTFQATNAIPIANARIGKLMQLCNEAITIDPEMTDANGAYILPLVEDHLPRLLAAHTQAVMNADAIDLDRIDDDLAKGVETVRSAVQKALDTVRNGKRDGLSTELRFLEYRHGSSNGDLALVAKHMGTGTILDDEEAYNYAAMKIVTGKVPMLNGVLGNIPASETTRVRALVASARDWASTQPDKRWRHALEKWLGHAIHLCDEADRYRNEAPKVEQRVKALLTANDGVSKRAERLMADNPPLQAKSRT